jgi:hypothetical protein
LHDKGSDVASVISNANMLKNELVSTNTNNSIITETRTLKPSVFPTDTCGDKMFFKNGDILNVKVLEISDKTIRYKRCDNFEGPDYNTSKGKVEMIKYANGFSESIDAPAYDYEDNKGDPYVGGKRDEHVGPPKVHPKAWYALIWFIVSPVTFFLTTIPALIYASKAMKEIKADPKKYKGLILASIIKTLSIILLSLLLLLVILALIGV